MLKDHNRYFGSNIKRKKLRGTPNTIYNKFEKNKIILSQISRCYKIHKVRLKN